MTFVTMAMLIPTLALLVLPGSGLGSVTHLDRMRTAILLVTRESWNNSQDICRNNYTDLVTIYNDKDSRKLKELLVRPGGWFGLKKGKNTYKWSNGDPFIYKPNPLNSPNPTVCVAMMASWLWDPVNCSLPKPFICYSDEPVNSPVYHQINITKTWYNAQNYCRTHFTDLVSIRNDEQNKAVFEMKSHTDPTWIGLIGDSWEWSDGGLSGYRDWIGDKPNPGKVAYLSTNGWDTDREPTNERAYFCYKAHIHISEESMTWERSLNYCGNNNRSSLSIESPVEQKVVNAFMRKNSVTGPVWVGLQQSRLFGFWVWTSTGSSVDWSNWEGGKKPKLPLSHPCGAMRENLDLKTWAWTDMNCMSKLQTLCYDPSFPHPQ